MVIFSLKVDFEGDLIFEIPLKLLFVSDGSAELLVTFLVYYTKRLRYCFDPSIKCKTHMIRPLSRGTKILLKNLIFKRCPFF